MMAYTFSLTTDVGKVRLLIPDRDSTDPLFQDDEITALLELEGSDVRRAAAVALELLASDQALTLKVIKLLDLTTDGAKTSDALLKRAALLRSQADDADMAEDGGMFDVAEMVPNAFAWRERIYKEAQRYG
jgi:hypothetical protein